MPASPAPSRSRGVSVAAEGRDLRLDLFRGLALVLMFVDHIPDNFLQFFTLKSVALSDAAEIFIFISGFVGATAYGRVLAERGVFAAALRIYRRAWTLFVAHVTLFMFYIAEVSYSVQHFGNAGYNDQFHITDFLNQPDLAVMKALSLQFQPTYLDILPLYIVLLLLFPPALWLLARRPMAVLIPSALLYVGVQIWQWNLAGFPAGRSWYFDPLAWQFLFLLGAACGLRARIARRVVPVDWRGQVTWAAAAVAGVGAALQLSVLFHTLWAGMPSLDPGGWATDKTSLALPRLLNFAALAFLASRLIARDSPILRWSVPQVLMLCGRHSLPVFCFNVLLALLGNVLIHEVSHSFPMQALVNLAGILALLGFAMALSWLDQDGKAMAKGAADAQRSEAPRPAFAA